MGRVVLVTGVSRDFGGRFARRIAADPAVERVIGVDVVPPRDDLGSVALRARRHPQPGDRQGDRRPGRRHGRAHERAVRPAEAGGRTSMKEHNVIGTMQLLAACQKAPGLERLVVKSSSAVYGSSSRDPAMFTEDMAPSGMPRSGYAKDVLEVEGYVRGFARRRPDVAVTMLRAANTVGPTVVLAAHPLLPAARRAHRARVRRPAAVPARGRPARRPAARHARRGARHLQRRRRRGADAVPGAAPAGPADGAGAGVRAELARVGVPAGRHARVSSRAGRLPHLRPRHRHLPDACRARVPAAYTTAEAFADFGRSVAPGLLPRPSGSPRADRP